MLWLDNSKFQPIFKFNILNNNHRVKNCFEILLNKVMFVIHFALLVRSIQWTIHDKDKENISF